MSPCKSVGNSIQCSRGRDPRMACPICGTPLQGSDLTVRPLILCADCTADAGRDPRFAAWAESQVARKAPV
jgi:hypothetical protein